MLLVFQLKLGADSIKAIHPKMYKNDYNPTWRKFCYQDTSAISAPRQGCRKAIFKKLREISLLFIFIFIILFIFITVVYY